MKCHCNPSEFTTGREDSAPSRSPGMEQRGSLLVTRLKRSIRLRRGGHLQPVLAGNAGPRGPGNRGSGTVLRGAASYKSSTNGGFPAALFNRFARGRQPYSIAFAISHDADSLYAACHSCLRSRSMRVTRGWPRSRPRREVRDSHDPRRHTAPRNSVALAAWGVIAGLPSWPRPLPSWRRRSHCRQYARRSRVGPKPS